MFISDVNRIISEKTRYCVSTLYIEETGLLTLDIALIQEKVIKRNKKITNNKIK